jgi:PAS domain S-box-containing protein
MRSSRPADARESFHTRSEAKGARRSDFPDLRQRAEELLGKHIRDLRAPARQEIQQLVHELEVHRVELEMQNRDLREAQQELEAARDRYADLYDFAPLGYVTLDGRGLIREINLTAARMLGRERKFLIGQPFASYMAWGHRQTFRSHLRTCVGGQGELTCEASLAPKDGPSVPVQLRSMSVEDAERGERLCRTAIIDITERKRAEDKLARHREELEQLGEARTRDLKEANKELESFAYTASHDLKAPLITITGFLGMLARHAQEDDREQMKSDMGRIHKAIEKMNRLLDDLLELSRVGHVAGRLEEVSLTDLAEEAAELLAGPILQRGVRVDISPDLPRVCGERPRLLELLMNLLGNAVKFMGDQAEPRVEIGARRDADGTVYYVRDNGMGVDPRYRDRIFGLFYRLDRSTKGTGIGLALAKRIVELHGGRIWVESGGCHKGSTFCFTLPRQEKPARPQEQENGRQTGERAAG